MARTGISYTDVERVCLLLQEKGESITIDTIRYYLGTGSRTTIANNLKIWRQNRPEESRVSLPDQLGLQVQGLFENMRNEANQKAESEINFAKAEISVLQEHVQELINQNESLKITANQNLNTINIQTEELQQRQTLIENYQLIEANNKAHVESMRHRLEEKQLQIEEFKHFNQQLQNNLNHFREVMSLQREEDKNNFERERRQFQEEVQYHKNNTLQHKLDVQDLTKVKDNLGLHILNLEVQIENLKGKTQELEAMLENKSEILNNTLQNLQKMESMQEQSLQEHKIKDETINAQKIETIKLFEKLNFIEKSHMNIENKNEVLQQEKLYLIQEITALKSKLTLFNQQEIL